MAEQSTSDLLDYMVLRYGDGGTTARANLLKWLQEAECQLWTAGPWWFREHEDSYTFTAGTFLFTLSADYADVLRLYNSSDDPMQKVSVHTFNRLYRPLSVTGEPRFWTLEPPESVPQLLKLRIWPAASSSYTAGRIVYQLQPGVLTDSDSNYSRFPRGDRSVVAIRGLKLLALHEGKPDLASQFELEEQKMMQNLAARNAEHQRGHAP